jgi:hypothetical protein
MTHHQQAIQVLQALIKQIDLHQSQGTPIMVQALVTSKYFPMLAISTHWPTPTLPGMSPPDHASCRDSKRSPATPKGGKDKDAIKQPNKKVRINVVKPRFSTTRSRMNFTTKNQNFRNTLIL